MAPLKIPRSSFAMALLEGDLYIIGGIEENGVSSAQVERFSFSTNMWFQATPLERPSYCSCACTVKGVHATRWLVCAETEDN
ncbi:kelch-like protein 33 [Haemaphysalis longicornis]